jgi:hypothetical protein
MRSFAECVLLLQMAHAEEVEDLGKLDSTLPVALEVEVAPPSDAGEGPRDNHTDWSWRRPRASPWADGWGCFKGDGGNSFRRPRGGGRPFAGGRIGFGDFKCKMLSL